MPDADFIGMPLETGKPCVKDEACFLHPRYYRSFTRWIIGHFLKQKGLFTGGYLFMLVSSILLVQIPILLREFFDQALPGGIQAVVDVSLRFLLISALVLASNLAGTFCNSWLTERLVSNVQNEFFSAIHQKSMKFHDSARTGVLLSLATSDSRNLSWMASSVRMLSLAILTTTSVAVTMLSMDTRLLVIFLIFTPFIALSIYRYSGKLARVSVERQVVFARWQATLQENLVGIRVLRTLSNRKRMFDRYKKDLNAVRRVLISRGIISSRYYSTLLIYGAMGCSLVVGSIFVMEGTMTVGTLVGFNSLILLVLNVNEFIRMSVFLGSMGFAGGRRVYAVLVEQQSLVDGNTPVPGRFNGHVVLENVDFRYDEDGRDVLKDVSIEIKPGQTVAIVGHTGSGKSTIGKLIQRLYDPTRGRVLVDGRDVRTYPIEDYRKQVGIIEQDPFIFSATIKENILYGLDEVGEGRGGDAGDGRENTSVTRAGQVDARVVKAAKAARIHDFIESLPDKYDTMVGERGITLSGGQKQRIAIARALIIDPPILIMDDSTSAIDARTEAMIQAAMKELVRKRTTIIITHRLSTIRNADLVVLLDHGRVRDAGTHEELYERQPDYAAIFAPFKDLPPIPELENLAKEVNP